MKNSIVNFRCSDDFKEVLQKEADLSGKSISDFIIFLVDKYLNDNVSISFSEPRNLGMTMKITYKGNQLEIPLYTEGNLCEAILYGIKETKSDEPFIITLFDSQDPVNGNLCRIECKDNLKITYLGSTSYFPINKKNFYSLLFSSFQENALFWSAEANYFRKIKKMTEEEKEIYLNKYKEKSKILNNMILETKKEEA